MTTSRSATGRVILHYDPDRVDYAVIESELRELEESGNTIWKDICLVSASASLGFAPNAVEEFVNQAVFHLTAKLFFNSTLGVISLVCAVAFGVAWKKAARSRRIVLERIRNKPKLILNSSNLVIEEEVLGSNNAPISVAGKA
jgi:hypothetical protein